MTSFNENEIGVELELESDNLITTPTCQLSNNNSSIQRSSPCRLFIPSAESQRICIICSFPEVDHFKNQQTSSWYKKAPNSLSVGNKRVNSCAYDIRVEYLPRSTFQAKYGAKLPIVLGDDNYVQLRTNNTQGHHDVRTVGEPLSDSEVFRRTSSSTSYYAVDNNQQKVTNKKNFIIDNDMIKNPIMLSPSTTSAFDEYRPPPTMKQENSENVNFATNNQRKKQPPPPPPPPPKYADERPAPTKNSVQFQSNDNVISCDGGQEYFMDSDTENNKDSTDDDFEDLLIAHEGSDGDDVDDIDWNVGDRKGEFDKMTKSNTEFNSNPKNLAFVVHQNVAAAHEKATKFIDKEMKKDLKLNSTVNQHSKNNVVALKNGTEMSANKHETVVGRSQTVAFQKSDEKNENSPQSCKKIQQNKLANRDSLSTTTTTNTTNCDSEKNLSTIVAVRGPRRPQSLILDSKNSSVENFSATKTCCQFDNNGNIGDNSPSPSKDLSELSSNLSSSADISLQTSPEHQQTKISKKPPLPANGNSSPADPMYTGRKTGKQNKTIDDRLKQMALDLETQRKGPKRPAPLPPTSLSTTPLTVPSTPLPLKLAPLPLTLTPTLQRQTPLSNRALAENSDRPKNKTNNAGVLSKRYSTDCTSFTVDNSCQNSTVTARNLLKNGRSVSQDRNFRNATTPDSETSTMSHRSKFASIRKFLKFEQKSPNETKFQSLRRLPSPFSRTRVDIGQQFKGLFHGVEKCTAADEIAQDSEVVVTDITEVNNSNGNESKNDQKMTKSDEKSVTLNNGVHHHQMTSPANESFVSSSDNSSQISVSAFKDDLKKSFRKVFRENSPNRAVANGHHFVRKPSPDLDSLDLQNPTMKKEIDYRKLIEETYDQMTMGHIMALSHVAENFPDLAFHWKRKAYPLVKVSELKWTDFLIVSSAPMMITESAAFYPGVLKLEQELLEMHIPKVNVMVTPMKYTNPMAMSSKKQHRPFFLPVIADFQEYVSSKLLRLTNLEEDSGSESPTILDNEQTMTLCKISILPRLVLNNIETYADQTANRHHPLKQASLHEKDVCFIMIQLIASLKYLQSQGIEEVPSDFDGFFLVRSSNIRAPHLVLCWETFLSSSTSTTSSASDIVASSSINYKSKVSYRQQRISLCQSALACLCLLLHTEVPTEEIIKEKRVPDFPSLSTYSEGFQKVADILNREKSHSLTQSKSLLEHMFWVSDHSSVIRDVQTKFDSEYLAKSWLENERAKQVTNILKMLLKQSDDLDIVEEYRVQFLLHTSAKQLFDAGNFLDERRQIINV